MFTNYFKIAIAVLKRRKFFTFISLFGISFTLMILIIVTAFFDTVFSPHYPDVNSDRLLYITRLQIINTKGQGQMNSAASLWYIDHYVSTLKTPVKVGILGNTSFANTYINDKKLVIQIRYTNDAFWDVMGYDFIEGKPYTLQQVKNGERVAVISENTKKDYFGDVVHVVGKYIETDNMQYRVSGVVKSLSVMSRFGYADMFVPYTVSKTYFYNEKELFGEYTAILLANTKDDLPKMKAEYESVAAKIKPDETYKYYDVFKSYADTYSASFFRDSPIGSDEDGGVSKAIFIAGVFALLFMLLPTINLVNINLSRIMERSSEIGVRKAFGASGITLVGQFIVENIILTFFGCVIGIALAFIILQVINNSNVFANTHLTINLTVLFLSLLACLVFGLLSGVYPAWRMSRLHVVTALKA